MAKFPASSITQERPPHVFVAHSTYPRPQFGEFAKTTQKFGCPSRCLDFFSHLLTNGEKKIGKKIHLSKKSPTGPTKKRTPKPEDLIARSQLTSGSVGIRSHLIFDGTYHPFLSNGRSTNPFGSIPELFVVRLLGEIVTSVVSSICLK